MEGDVSNKTIVVLVILTVIISVLGTLVVLTEVNNIKVPAQPAKTTTSAGAHGYVMLNILPLAESRATGHVTLTLVDNKNTKK
jgi:cell division protein FtsN